MKTIRFSFFLIFNADLSKSVEPDEILENAELEEMAREIGRNLSQYIVLDKLSNKKRQIKKITQKFLVNLYFLSF